MSVLNGVMLDERGWLEVKAALSGDSSDERGWLE